ncbi:transporter [Sphingomonas floccifaciens]|uniref:Transporter n=1 Tax=Sphingomonas floccifaciens TaxID=1844115 RepID=A0ABW4NFZ7_9SPHN
MMRILPILLTALVATPAQAQGLRDFCADRPGLGTPACTLDPGHVMAETGLADWTLDRSAGQRTDTTTLADTLLRIGLDAQTEAQVGWTAVGLQRQRDASGMVERSAGVGDMTLALRRNFSNPDGSGVSVAAMGIASLPTGGQTIGAGDWGAAMLVPMSVDLPGGLNLQLTPEVDAAVDEDRHGRHLTYGSVVGLQLPFGKSLSATGELSVFRDDDPGQHVTKSIAGVSLGWQRGKNLQFDAGANVGLNRTTDDLELYVGVARRF